MGGKQRIYKQRIQATETLRKVFRAMELIAASRIGKARRLAAESDPFTKAITQAVAAVSQNSNLNHPLTTVRRDTRRVAVVCVTADRGMAGAYSASILRETEAQLERLREDGMQPVLYVVGRRGESFFRFRGVEIERAWTGESDSPSKEMVAEISDELLERFLDPDPYKGVSEVHLIFTRFLNMVKQVVEDRKMLPLKVVERSESKQATPPPLYSFEPSAHQVMEELLPMYVFTRLNNALLQSAASELASRQRSMHTATENAEELINKYTRLANSARQSEITQEISEIVSGADALSESRN